MASFVGQLRLSMILLSPPLTALFRLLVMLKEEGEDRDGSEGERQKFISFFLVVIGTVLLRDADPDTPRDSSSSTDIESATGLREGVLPLKQLAKESPEAAECATL